MIESDKYEKPQVQEVSADESLSSFGGRLREIRLELDLKQLDVKALSWDIAEREGSSSFCISNSRLSAIEHGHALPGPAKLLALGEIYGLTLEQLIKLWATINP